MRPDTLVTLVLGLAVAVAVARLLGGLTRRVGQPAVVGEIAGGILLGSTLFGGAVNGALFPADVRPALGAIADIGVYVFMFLVGLELDRRLLREQSRVVVTVTVGSMVLPFGLGVLLAVILLANHPTEHRLAFVLFVGTAMAVTAFPVLARILAERGLIRTPIGGIALASAAAGDVVAWSMLAVVAALAGVDGGEVWVLLGLPFAALMLWFVRPLLARVARRHVATSGPAVAAVLAATAIALALSVSATDWMGLHGMFGAFLFGVVLPRDEIRALRERVLPWIERGCSILLPVFFVVAGLEVDLSSMGSTAWTELALILLVATGGKLVGTYLGARASGVRQRHSIVLAVLLDTRGLTEMVVILVGLQIGVLDASLGSLLIVMALVTTVLTGVLLRLVYPDARARRDAAGLDAKVPDQMSGSRTPTKEVSWPTE